MKSGDVIFAKHRNSWHEFIGLITSERWDTDNFILIYSVLAEGSIFESDLTAYKVEVIDDHR